jgi:hypothetical protein
MGNDRDADRAQGNEYTVKKPTHEGLDVLEIKHQVPCIKH